MSGEQAIFNIEIKKKSGLSLNPDIHHSKVFSSDQIQKKVKIIPTDIQLSLGTGLIQCVFNQTFILFRRGALSLHNETPTILDTMIEIFYHLGHYFKFLKMT